MKSKDTQLLEEAYFKVKSNNVDKAYQQYIEETFKEISQGITGQTINFGPWKQDILKVIKKMIDGVPKWSFYGDEREMCYNAISGNKGQEGDAERMGFSPEFKERWEQTFRSDLKSSNGEWQQIHTTYWAQTNINSKKYLREPQDHTFNYYITITKTKDNIIKFFDNYSKIKDAMIAVSDSYQTPISFKTIVLLDNFISHNDNLKVFFYDSSSELKQAITNAIKKWLSDNNIQVSERTHVYGMDTKGYFDGGSYGQRVSRHMFDVLLKTVQTHGTKYTPEAYYQWIVKHAASIIKQFQ